MTDSAVAGFHSNLDNPTTLKDPGTISIPTMVVCGARTTAPDRRVTEIVRDRILGSAYRIASSTMPSTCRR